MPAIIRLENLPSEAGSNDIRRFFQGLQIPDGGVCIVGGERGEAFIAFPSDDDSLQAMQKNGGLICQQQVRLDVSSNIEMQHALAAAEGKPSTSSNLAPANVVPQLLQSNLNNLPLNVPAPVQGHGFTETAAILHIFSNAAYFMIKSCNEQNVSLAKYKGVWSTQLENESKLNQAFRDHQNVILFFSVNGSKAFQGVARMSCQARHDGEPINWLLPPGKSNADLKGIIDIDWITRRTLPFIKTSHLFNEWNENEPVKKGRDGQGIEPCCGEALCRLFPLDPSINIMSIVVKAKQNKKRFLSRSRSRSPLSINVRTLRSVIIKPIISKDDNRRSPKNRHRSKSSDISSHHSTKHYHHRSPSNHDRRRHRKSRSRKSKGKDFQRKRRKSSDQSEKSYSNRKDSHSPNNGTNAQSGFPLGSYSVNYNPSSFYLVGYDHRGITPMILYPNLQPQSSISSRSQNPPDYEQEINALPRRTTSNSYQTNDNKSHRNHRSSSRDRSKLRKHRY